MASRWMMFLNHLATGIMLVSFFAPFVSPAQFWPVAFAGLGFPLLVAAHLLFVLYWGLQKNIRVLYSLILLACAFPLTLRFVQLDLKGAAEEKTGFTVLTWNVKSFDLYNWSKNLQARDEMFSLIEDHAPDIACFQEFFHRDTSVFSNVDSLMLRNGWEHVHAEFTTNKPPQHWGLATFSRYPIIARGRIPFAGTRNNICIFTDIVRGGDTIRVYNMHLQSIAFSKADYQYVKDLAGSKETEDIEHSANILKRLKRAFIMRAAQAEIVRISIENSPFPVIVCGDFNDTPSSYAYQMISENLTDGFIAAGSGLGKTYYGVFPSFRIDYILASPAFRFHDFTTVNDRLSDHFPNIAEVSLD